jgi:hypothetical protein
MPQRSLGPDLPLPKSTPFSTAVGHYRGMKQLAHNSKTPHGSPCSPPSVLLPTRSLLGARLPTVFDHRLRLADLFLRFRATPANFNTSPSLHSICIRPASAAPASSFRRLFRRRGLNSMFRSNMLTRAAPPNKRWRDPGTISEASGIFRFGLPIYHAHQPTQVPPLGRANSLALAVPAWAGEFAIARGGHGTTRNLLVGKVANGRG